MCGCLKINCLVKFGFSEKAPKFEKNLCRTFDMSVVCVLCVQQHTCQKVDEDFKKKCGQVVLYKL